MLEERVSALELPPFSWRTFISSTNSWADPDGTTPSSPAGDYDEGGGSSSI
jgi:hypothetical protein